MSEEDQVISMQRTDTRVSAIMEILGREQSGRSTTENELVKNYQLQSGMLYKKGKVNNEQRLLWEVPNAMRKSIVVRFHDMAGHFAVDQTVNKIQEW